MSMPETVEPTTLDFGQDTSTGVYDVSLLDGRSAAYPEEGEILEILLEQFELSSIDEDDDRADDIISIIVSRFGRSTVDAYFDSTENGIKNND